jgi:uncharacterized protein (UPF0332 family)
VNERVQSMLRMGRLRTEEAAKHGAASMVSKAREFLEAARGEVTTAPSVAFANAYTAARQAVTALMWSEGLRVGERSREHETVVDYARAAIPTTRDLDLAVLDRMRRRRHEIEYEPHRDATQAEAKRACSFVSRLIGTVEKRLQAETSP